MRHPAPGAAPAPAAAAAPRPAVLTPCVNLCKMDAASGLCAGCLRTLDEIVAWGRMDDDARRAVMATLPQRRLR